MRRRLCFMAPAALLILSCAEKPRAPEPGPGALPTYEQFRAAHPGRAFQATPERRANVLAALNAVRPGMSRHQVASALGRPDWARDLARKESPRIVGSEWAYALAKPDLDLVNERNDQAVYVYFSPAGVVHEVRRMKIAEAAPTERPAGT
jgi:hypothetical protein